MAFTVVILAAGIGKRIGPWSDVFSKALLPINHKPVISQIIDKFAPQTKVVVAVGHQAQTVRTWLETAYPSRSFTFVTVDRYSGEGSGPGYSLLQCRPHLNGPFVLYAVDTVVTGPVPEPSSNWFGVAEVTDTVRFCSVQLDADQRVTRIDDKKATQNTWAFIGLAGIADSQTFFDGLLSDRTLIGGELQLSNGFQALLNSGDGLRARPFRWFDTGTLEEYAVARAYFALHPEQL